MHERKSLFTSRENDSLLPMKEPKIMPPKYAKPGKGLRQRGKAWYLSFTPEPGAKQVSICLHTEDKAEAETRAQAVRNRPQSVGLGTWKDEMEFYFQYRKERNTMTAATRRSTEEVLTQFFRVVGCDTSKEVHKAEVLAFKADLEKRGVGLATMSTYNARLLAFFEFCVRWERIFENPIRRYWEVVRIPPSQLARDKWIDKIEIRRLLRKCKDDDLKFVLFMGFHCGLRKKEIIMARPHWFDMQAERLNVPYLEVTQIDYTDGSQKEFIFTSKGKRDRSIPLTRYFRIFLNTRFKMGNVWCLEPKHKKGFGKRYRWDFRRPLEAYFKKMGVDLNTHGLRHSFASNAIRDRSTLEVASYLGNRERTVETHYAHIRSGKGALDKSF